MVPGEDLPVGTPIATGWDKDGNYPNKSSGNHAALFVEWKRDNAGKVTGMWIFDQHEPNEHGPGRAEIRFKRLDRAKRYHVIRHK